MKKIFIVLATHDVYSLTVFTDFYCISYTYVYSLTEYKAHLVLLSLGMLLENFTNKHKLVSSRRELEEAPLMFRTLLIWYASYQKFYGRKENL